jgi:upstream-binding transcription factor
MATTITTTTTTTTKKTNKRLVSEALKPVLADVQSLSANGKVELFKRLVERDELDKMEELQERYGDLDEEGRAAFRKALTGNKRNREPRLEGQPREAKSAWNFFCEADEFKEAIKAENPDIKQPDVMKKLGDQWKKMSAEDKAPYEELARQDKERQAPLIAAFKLEHPEAFDEKGKRIHGVNQSAGGAGGAVEMSSDKSTKKRAKRTSKPKKEKDPNAPKKAINGYLFYAQHARKEGLFADVAKSDFKKVCGAAWKALSPEEKKPFEALVKADKQRYEEEKALYAQQQINEAPTQPLAEAQGEEMDESSEVSSSSEDDE